MQQLFDLFDLFHHSVFYAPSLSTIAIYNRYSKDVSDVQVLEIDTTTTTPDSAYGTYDIPSSFEPYSSSLISISNQVGSQPRKSRSH